METIQEKRLKVLNDTISYFNTKTRNINHQASCQYYPQHEDTEGCAVGRLIKDKQLCKKLDEEIYSAVNDVFRFLPVELQDLGVGFLKHLQILHDSKINWTEHGLSEIGKITSEQIKSQYCL